MEQHQNQNICSHMEEAAVQPSPESRGSGFLSCHPRLRHLLVGLLFVGLFILLQLAVTAAASAVLGIKVLAESGMDLSAPVEPEFYEDLMARAGWMVGGSNLLTILTLILFFRSRGVPGWLGLGLVNPEKKPLYPLLFWGLLLNLGVNLALGLLPAQVLESYAGSAAIQAVSSTDFFTVLSVVLLAPLCEEVIFRHLAYGNFRQAMPVWAALVLQALLFAAMHEHPVQMIYAFGMALILGLVREKKKTVLGSILLHMGFNGANYLYMMLIPGL